MPHNAKAPNDQGSPKSVHVAIYDHPHGTDVRVFLARDRALNWRTGIAKEWWSNAYDDDPPPDDEIGEKYFDRMLDRGEEFFSIQLCDVEVGEHAPTDPTVLAPRSASGGASC
ncbi:hypothetical protein [Brucella sp. 2716]|uniref:hypothetical protein n=1 Tax=Brucella sp. 2716 TaxID=2975052 RepID=UPI00217EB2E3|nr:hypothetical protein [Brucella sp. 2716]UWF58503.1 hypothetical protein NYO66_07985 [Brucella sp. 2716]